VEERITVMTEKAGHDGAGSRRAGQREWLGVAVTLLAAVAEYEQVRRVMSLVDHRVATCSLG
jgi:hypothetical protein